MMKLSGLLLASTLWVTVPPARAAEPAESSLLIEARKAFQSGNREEAVRIATRMIEANPTEPNSYFLRARFHELMGRREDALKDYTKLLEVAPQAKEVYYHRAVQHFLLGHIPESAADFDRFVDAQPERVPALWQRGITLYYAGRFEDGRKQFEMHRTVNPGDVENSTWHFICLAREKGVEEARKNLLPVTGDTRVPMAEILDFYAGKGSPEKVLEKAASGNATGPLKAAQIMYGHLYLALYYEATGDLALRRTHLQKAVATNLKNEYMWEVARVHLDLLDSGKLK